MDASHVHVPGGDRENTREKNIGWHVTKSRCVHVLFAWHDSLTLGINSLTVSVTVKLTAALIVCTEWPAEIILY